MCVLACLAFVLVPARSGQAQGVSLPSACSDPVLPIQGWQSIFGVPWDGVSTLVFGAEVQPGVIEIYRVWVERAQPSDIIHEQLVGYFVRGTGTSCDLGPSPSTTVRVLTPDGEVEVTLTPQNASEEGTVLTTMGPGGRIRLATTRFRVSVGDQVVCDALTFATPTPAGSTTTSSSRSGSGNPRELEGGPPRGGGNPTVTPPGGVQGAGSDTTRKLEICGIKDAACRAKARLNYDFNKNQCSFFNNPTPVVGVAGAAASVVGAACAGATVGGPIGAAVGGVIGLLIVQHVQYNACLNAADQRVQLDLNICRIDLQACILEAMSPSAAP